MTLFVVSIITVMVVSVYELQLAQWAAVRNTSDYEKALYLAGAAVHHALAEIEDDADWRAGIASTEYPSGSGQTYSATVVDDTSGMVVITASGTANDVTRKLQVTIDPGD
jgi:type II secretory pathway component PulK